MNKKDYTNFKKSNNSNSQKNKSKHQNQRDRVKTKIMNKYNLSSQEANDILIKIEKKEKLKNNLKNNQNNNAIMKYDITNNNLSNSNQMMLNDDTKINNPIIKIDDANSKKQNSINDNNTNEPKQKNVDSILQEILPDYKNQISIKVEHVDLTFEVQNEKIDTIKESFIRTLKRNNTKKIKIHALNDISFEIYKGEKVGIIGYNGAGKSTLLNVITGIYQPDKGKVTTNGKIAPLLSLGAGFDPSYSGRKNILLNGAVLGYDKDYLESKMDEIIEFSELGDLIDIPIKNYSSGMLAKLGFSIATSVNPDILIIDEILGVGDVNFKKKSADKIKSLMDGGTTVLLVSHSIPQILELCNKAIWINDGKLKEIGEVNTICNHYLKDAEKASKEQLANIQFK